MSRVFKFRFPNGASVPKPGTLESESAESVIRRAVTNSKVNLDTNRLEGKFRVMEVRCVSEEQASTFRLSCYDVINTYSAE